MDKNAIWKWLILVVLVALSLAVVIPPGEKIKLGIDLKGGTSFTVKIDEDQVRADILAAEGEMAPEALDAAVTRTLRGAQERAVEVLRNRVDSLGVREPIIYPGKDGRVVIQLPEIDEEQVREAEEMIKRAAFLEFKMVHKDNRALVKALFDKGVVPSGYRLFNLSEDNYYKRAADYEAVSIQEGYRNELKRFEAPDGRHDFMLEKEEVQGHIVYRPVFVQSRRTTLTGEFLKDAAVDYRGLGQPVVLLEFDAKGAKHFSRITDEFRPGGRRNPDQASFRQLAIVMDGTLYSAPIIREAIHGGKAEISGSFSVAEATFLANILRSGSLPAPMEIVEKRFVSPTLGKDSIQSGLRAVIMGGIGVVAFMLIYYMLSGVIANLALLLNMILLPLGMIVAAGFLGIFAKDAPGSSVIQLPVLTLPGIAGILLTIGMAVDANVLIFERIREESKVGKRLWSAITAGYDRAFRTIMDANLTTLLTGIILFVFGSGPIRGFAVTLCAGIMVSMFTALVVTKLFFGVLAKTDKIRTV